MNACGTNINSIATPLICKACKLHSFIFGMVYEYPIPIRIENHQTFRKVDNIFQAKYKFFLFSLFCLIITLFACIILITLNLFISNTSRVTFVAIVYCVYLGSCVCLELCTVLEFSKPTEAVFLFNQLFLIERKCKF